MQQQLPPAVSYVGFPRRKIQLDHTVFQWLSQVQTCSCPRSVSRADASRCARRLGQKTRKASVRMSHDVHLQHRTPAVSPTCCPSVGAQHGEHRSLRQWKGTACELTRPARPVPHKSRQPGHCALRGAGPCDVDHQWRRQLRKPATRCCRGPAGAKESRALHHIRDNYETAQVAVAPASNRAGEAAARNPFALKDCE